jgi:hypothetical protein
MKVWTGVIWLRKDHRLALVNTALNFQFLKNGDLF